MAKSPRRTKTAEPSTASALPVAPEKNSRARASSRKAAPHTPAVEETMTVVAEPVAAAPVVATPATNVHDLHALAYHLWQQRGCPHGSPDVDWLHAEQELRRRSRS